MLFFLFRDRSKSEFIYENGVYRTSGGPVWPPVESTLEECQTACAGNDSCNGIQYDDDLKMCYIIPVPQVGNGFLKEDGEPPLRVFFKSDITCTDGSDPVPLFVGEANISRQLASHKSVPTAFTEEVCRAACADDPACRSALWNNGGDGTPLNQRCTLQSGSGEFKVTDGGTVFNSYLKFYRCDYS